MTVKAFIDQEAQEGMVLVIPPRKNRKIQSPYSKELYKPGA